MLVFDVNVIARSVHSLPEREIILLVLFTECRMIIVGSSNVLERNAARVLYSCGDTLL